MTKERKFTVYMLVTAFLLIAFDQITKLIAMGVPILGIQTPGIRAGEYISVIGTFLQFTYVENAGMAFGITFGAGKIFLSLFSVIASIGLVYLLFKIENYSKWVRLAFAVILAGAAGNLIDRVFYGIIFGTGSGTLFYGNVIDFIIIDIPDINFFGLNYTHWPVFNVADACVTIGVILLLINYKNMPQFEDIKLFRKKNIEKN